MGGYVISTRAVWEKEEYIYALTKGGKRAAYLATQQEMNYCWGSILYVTWMVSLSDVTDCKLLLDAVVIQQD
eukprot:11542044-Ditylum_brightwellii.AAC.1